MKLNRVPCTVGASGDAYCKAYYGQFVLGEAQVEVSCQGICQWSPADDQGVRVCTPDNTSGACTPAGSCTPDGVGTQPTCTGLFDDGCDTCGGILKLPVTRPDAGTNREPPCLQP
jgi:hypothetical protein